MAVFHYDDSDDHGIPILQIPPRTSTQRLRLGWQRYRSATLLCLAVFLLIYWFSGTTPEPSFDWSTVAYAQYATDSQSLCNSLMIFESLHQLGSKADRVLLYPQEWDAAARDNDDRNTQLLSQAHRLYNVKLQPIQLLSIDGAADPGTFNSPSGYGTSITKFRLFELDQYDRILYFDSDSILQQHMDELFHLPPTPIAMPRAYWSDQPRDSWPLSSTLMLIQPDLAETKHLYETLQWWRLSPDRDDSRHYDNDLINDRFGSSALVLPHRPYMLQTCEFRWHDHAAWLGSYGAPMSTIKWDPWVALKEAKLIHFSDWPLPKPWIMWPHDVLMEIQPDCGISGEASLLRSCDERKIWIQLYDDFRQRRKDVCKILPAPAPSEKGEKEEAGEVDGDF